MNDETNDESAKDVNGEENKDGAEQLPVPADSEPLPNDGQAEDGAEEWQDRDAPRRDSGLGSCGDFIISELSAENTAHKINNFFKTGEDVARYIVAFLYIIAGMLCAVLPEQIEHVLSYIVGTLLLIASVTGFIFAIIRKEYKSDKTNKTVSSFILILVSVMIICMPSWAYTFIMILWGVLGLCEAAFAFNRALARISRGISSCYYIVKGIIELVMAFLLLCDAEEYGETHLIVFGISLVLDGIAVLPVWDRIIK